LLWVTLYSKASKCRLTISWPIWQTGTASRRLESTLCGKNASVLASFPHPYGRVHGRLRIYTKAQLFFAKPNAEAGMPTQHPSDSFAAHRFNPLDIPTHLLERFEESPLLNFPPAAAPAETGIYGTISPPGACLHRKGGAGKQSKEAICRTHQKDRRKKKHQTFADAVPIPRHCRGMGPLCGTSFDWVL